MLSLHLVNILVCSVSWLGIAGCIIACLWSGSVIAGSLATSTRPLTPSTPLGETTRHQGKGWGEKSLDALQKKCVCLCVCVCIRAEYLWEAQWVGL